MRTRTRIDPWGTPHVIPHRASVNIWHKLTFSVYDVASFLILGIICNSYRYLNVYNFLRSVCIWEVAVIAKAGV